MSLFGPPNIEKMKAKQDIKGLIKALHHPDPKIAQSAAGALAQIGEPAVDSVIAATQDSYTTVRYYAARILGQIRSSRGVSPLLARLSDPDKNVRLCVIEALGSIGDGRATEALLAGFKSSDRDVQKCAKDSLDKIGDARAMEPLIAALKDSDKVVRQYAVVALGQLSNTRAIEALIAALRAANHGTETDEPTRQLVAETFIKIGPPAVKPLIAALKDEYWNVRRTAAEVLGQLKDARAVLPLIDALKDQDVGIRFRSAAAEALEEINWQPGRDATGAAYWIVKQNWEECVRIGAPAVELLIAALKDSDKDVRLAAAGALGEIKDARAVESLIAALRDSSGDVGDLAASALGKIGAPAMESLFTALKNEFWDVRQAAVRALGEIGTRQEDAALKARAMELLAAALQDSENILRMTAAEELGKIGAQLEDAAALRFGIVEPLIGMLKGGDWAVRKAAAIALITIYKSGQIDDTNRDRILSKRKEITHPHKDIPNSSDYHACFGYFVGGEGEDTGIGVDFPI